MSCWGHPSKGRSQGKRVPRGNEIAVSLPSYGSLGYCAGRSLLFTFARISGIRVGEGYFPAPVTHANGVIATRRSSAADLSFDRLCGVRFQSASSCPDIRITSDRVVFGRRSLAGTVEKLTGRDLSKGRPGRPRKRPVSKTVLCPQNSVPRIPHRIPMSPEFRRIPQ